uniref:Uncharacterized protein n=1 Tax=Gopherus agassizii TaxID=38772 RepID=A0A452GL18_9SAUR
MEKDVSSSHKRYMQGVQLSNLAPGVHRVLTETSDLYRSKSVSGLPLKPELTSLTEKTLQEVGKKSCPSEKQSSLLRDLFGEGRLPASSTLGKQEMQFKSSQGFSCLPGQCIRVRIAVQRVTMVHCGILPGGQYCRSVATLTLI